MARLGVVDPGFLNIQPDKESLSIVSCSFVKDVKRIELIIDAIDYILNTHPLVKIKWTHIGDGELYDEIRNYAVKKLNTRANVVFTGYLTESEIMNLYKNESFDVFINVSSSEGLPVTLMEASSVGLPLIATDVGGSKEIVNFENGILIHADSSVETIASSLLRFQDKNWASELRKKSKLYWNEKFNAEINHNIFVMKLVNILELDK
jgi:glycosyltransferase involved in cell wall biosynthesis